MILDTVGWTLFITNSQLTLTGAVGANSFTKMRNYQSESAYSTERIMFYHLSFEELNFHHLPQKNVTTANTAF